MKFIEGLRDKHLGKEIWILGCGPSLDDYPNNFFNDKISIGLNCSFLAFPFCTYYCSGHPEVFKAMVKKNPELLKRTIFPLPVPVPKKLELKWLEKYKVDIIFATFDLGAAKNPKRFRRLLKPTIECIIKKTNPICHFVILRTILHVGIQCAATLGAKKITLVGCEASARKGHWHARRDGMPAFYKYAQQEWKRMYKKAINYPERTKLFPLGTRLLTQTFTEYGIQISKYYYRTGYQKII